jgi:hypothetical protein
MSSWISVQKRPVRIFENQNKSDRLETVKNTIYYIAGGKLGDFIYQLSVIKYNYDKLGKKGVLYLANIGDKFSFSLDKTYNDTKELISKQEYIKDYQVYNNQKYDINLSSWRSKVTVSNIFNWIQIYKISFDIEWAKTKWLENIYNDTSLNDTILITHSLMRYNNNIDFSIINTLVENNNVSFICFDMIEYDNFRNKYNININTIVCKDINEIAIKINSCKLLIGNLSAPLAVSLALHKRTIGILPTEPIHFATDVNLNSNLKDTLPFYTVINNNDEFKNAIINII